MAQLTDEQREAIESVDHHVLVSAGAGAGKTLVLVERYIEVLRRFPDARIDDIIAVTYTRKAADEMRSRLKQRLRDLTLAAEDDSDRQRWSECLAEVDGAKIGTIHSLCESILKAYTADAGVDPSFQLVDDLERAELLKASIDAILARMIADPKGKMARLIDYPVEVLQGWLSQLVTSHLQYRHYRSIIGKTEEDLRNHSTKFIEEAITHCLSEILSQPEFKWNVSYLKSNLWPDPRSTLGFRQAQVITLLKTVTDDLDVQRRWKALTELAEVSALGGGEQGQPLRDAIKAVKEVAKQATKVSCDLNPADDNAFQILASLLDAADEVLAGYEFRKNSSQKLDFDDLISRTHWLLTKPGSRARADLSRRLRAVLVDEFQDTNTVQSELIAALAGDKTRLFLIGDDKQSIYKFQGADVGTFNFVKSLLSRNAGPHAEVRNERRNPATNHFPEGPSKLLSLSWSFRSHPEIVAFVNAVFAKLFGGNTSSFKSAHQALKASRRPTGDGARVEVTLFDGSAEESDESHRLEAQLVAQRIKELVKDGLMVFDKGTGENRAAGYGDFAILLQASADFQFIEESLAAAAIPYVSYSGSGFLEKQEVLDLENLLRFLASPADSHALFAALRSPLFGISDDLLHSMQAGQSQSLWRSLIQAADSFGELRLARAVKILRSLREIAPVLPLSRLCRKIILLSAYDVVLLSGRGGKQRSRNVWKFLALAANHDHMSITEFLSALSTMRALGVRNQTEAPLAVDGAVKVMTIHKSKGLEFGAVVLPRLDRKVHIFHSKLITGKQFAIALDITRDKGEQKPAYFMAADRLNKLMDEEEKKRLLYVALTRARDHLCLFLPFDSSKHTSLGYWLRSVIDVTGEPGEYHINDESRYAIRFAEVPAVPEQPEETAPPEEPPVFAGLNDRLLEPVSRPGDFVAKRANLPGRVSPPAAGWKPDPTVAGTFFHSIMSRLDSDMTMPVEEVLRSICFTELAIVLPEQQQELIGQVTKLFDIFRKSPLSTMIQSSKRRFHECPYWVMRGNDPEGRPDLVLEDEVGAWHIIDYKTDHVTKEDLQRHIRTYTAQLTGYVEDWRLITGVTARPWLYFAQLGRLEPLDTQRTMQLALQF